MDCIFCKIINQQIPCHLVAQTPDYLAFLDINPVRPGHTLVIPKGHWDSLAVTPPEVVAGLFKFAQTVARSVLAGTGSDGFNLTVNNGAAAGQVVNHTHIHIIPRQVGDGLPSWPQGDYLPDQAGQLAEKISQLIKFS